LEEEIDEKVETTPWTSILKLFVKSYDPHKESLEIHVANVNSCAFSLSGVKDLKLTKNISLHHKYRPAESARLKTLY